MIDAKKATGTTPPRTRWARIEDTEMSTPSTASTSPVLGSRIGSAAVIHSPKTSRYGPWTTALPDSKIAAISGGQSA